MSERIIIATKAGAKSNGTSGVVHAIAEEANGKLVPITSENFCSTKQAFIVGGYEEIDAKYKDGELFRIQVEINQYGSQIGSAQQCLYKSAGNYTSKLQPNEIVEVIQAELPDPNDRELFHSDLPSTKYILIQDKSGECYGPFDWKYKSEHDDEICIELEVIKGGRLGEIGRNHQVNRITPPTAQANIIKVDSFRGKLRLVKDVSTLLTEGWRDYASDKDIIGHVRSLARDNAGRKIDRNFYLSITTRAGQTKEGALPLNKTRISQFKQIITANADLLDEINDVFTTFLNNQEGAKILEDYVERNRSKYIEQLKKEREYEFDENFKKRLDEKNQLERDIDNLRRQATQLRDDHLAQKKKLERELDKNVYLENVSEKHQKRMAEMAAEEEAITKRIELLRPKYELYKNNEDIERQIQINKAVLKRTQDELYEEKQILRGLKDESRKAEVEIHTTLKRMKPYIDHLNGAYTTDDEAEVPRIEVVCNALPSDHEQIHTQRAIINSIRAGLASEGRLMSDEEVANILISTQQSYITFFAGLPGVGKTSTCQYLAKAQRLESRLLNVSVARGWTSIKDMVGFHNPLTQTFQRSPTGMYDFLRSLDKESQGNNPNSNAMAYILMDEANLSSIEHYWSAFMGMADKFEENTLDLGPNSLRLPSGLRFLATINYDGTTEALSPRILDRASVIVMPPDDHDEAIQAAGSALQALPISYADMERLFGRESNASPLEVAESAVLNAISDILSMASADQGRGVHISKRKREAIRQYCNRARPLMNDEPNSVVALDYAVKQHVLPLISGYGSKFATRLNLLKKTVAEQGLEMSADYLDQMIVHGQNDLHSYEFFCW